MKKPYVKPEMKRGPVLSRVRLASFLSSRLPPHEEMTDKPEAEDGPPPSKRGMSGP